jgi:large subunit ribosomal protein L21
MATTTKTTKELSPAFAVILTGGKQYIVRQGDTITIEKLDGEFEAGKTLTFDQVLMTTDGTKTVVGTPTVAGATVTAEFIAEGKGDKVLVIKYKAKSRYFKKRGHRQPFMKFKVTKIA